MQAAGDEVMVVTQLGTIAAAAAMRSWFGYRRGIPLRFSRPPRALAVPAE